MAFNSRAFAVFFVLVFCAFWALRRSPRWRVLLLLAASYGFYGHWDPRFLSLIVGSTVLDYFVGLAVHRAASPSRRKLLLSISLVGNLGLLALFKYYNFFAAQLEFLLGGFGVQPGALFLDVVLPVGISFYTFQTLSYTIDIYRGVLEPERDFTRFALYVAFFPQLVAGPIVRARHFLPQIAAPPSLNQRGFEAGLFLIFWGLVKKIVIADYLGSQLVDPCWADPAGHGGWATLLAVYGYAFQIYGDFSGYSDIAIGTALLLGFELGLNFDSPYRAASPRELWTRWHISLSSWLRDYLYISLGGNRGAPWKTYRNLLLTMLLGGLWHGASWMFVLWGLYHGLLLIGDRLLGLGEPRGRAALWLRRALMFHLVCLGWIWFRSADWASASAVLSSLTAPRGTAEVPLYALLVLALACLTHFPSRDVKHRVRDAFVSLPAFAQGAAYALLLGLLLNATALDTPFIYFQF